MSWIIKEIIKNSDNTRSQVFSEDSAGIIETNLDNPDYDRLLTVEMKMQELTKCGILNKDELSVLDSISKGKTLEFIAKQMGVGRSLVKKLLTSATDKISFALGGDYTDDGYINYMIEKYKLNEEQVQRMLIYMENN